MDKKELRKANGDVFFEAARQVENAFILVNWIGIQSVETIMMGANLLLTMLRQEPCAALLNSNKELIGPWNDGALFLGARWAPQAKSLGMVYFAQVLAPGVYGQRSFHLFLPLAQPHLQVEIFETDAAAEAWLQDLA
jgi:hypothetical protein